MRLAAWDRVTFPACTKQRESMMQLRTTSMKPPSELREKDGKKMEKMNKCKGVGGLNDHLRHVLR